MAFLAVEKSFTRKWVISNSLIVLGSYILKAGFVLFI